MKLNLGAGATRLPGYMSVDIMGRADKYHDLGSLPWPFDDGGADEILASHVLEHFDLCAGRDFLAECRRILQPGGLLHLAVPDMDKFIRCQLKRDWSELGGYQWVDLNHFMGGDMRETVVQQRHRHMYSFGALAWELQTLGFHSIHRRGYPAVFDNAEYAALSLYVDCVR